jgi:hypothetical protein
MLDAREPQLAQGTPGGGHEETADQRVWHTCAPAPADQRLGLHERHDARIRVAQVVRCEMHGRGQAVGEVHTKPDRRRLLPPQAAREGDPGDRSHHFKVGK